MDPYFFNKILLPISIQQQLIFQLTASHRASLPVHGEDIQLVARSPSVFAPPVQVSPHALNDGPENTYQEQYETSCHQDVRKDSRHRGVLCIVQRLHIGTQADEAKANE